MAPELRSHEDTQTPPAQISLPLHGVPQAPQWLESVCVSAQDPVTSPLPPPQAVWPDGQDAAQKPFAQNPPPAHTGAQPAFVQTWPVEHTVPQVPQLFGSVVTSVQPSPHAAHVPPPVAQLEQLTLPSSDDGAAQPLDVLPPPQLGEQTPWLQAAPPVQDAPQLPQLLLSVIKSMHCPGSLGQVVNGDGHADAQNPPLQTAQLPPAASFVDTVVASCEELADASWPPVAPVVDASGVLVVPAPPSAAWTVAPASSGGTIVNEPVVEPSATKPSLKWVT